MPSGDAAFQAKCLGKMDEIAEEGRTVIFVSHNMGAITKLCTRVCWIEGGRLAYDGAPTDAVGEYLASSVPTDATWAAETEPAAEADASAALARTTSELSLLTAGVRDAKGRQATAVRFDEPFRVEVSYRVDDSIENAAVLVSFMDLAGNLIFESWDTDSGLNGQTIRRPGTYLSSCIIPKMLLKPGRYWLSLGAHIPNAKILDRREHVLAFDVLPVEGHVRTDRLGLLVPVLDWEAEKLS